MNDVYDVYNDIREYRLVFDRIITGAKIQKTADYLRSQFSLHEERIRVILTSPPRIITSFSTEFDAQDARRSLEKIGCLTDIEPVVRFNGIPIEISLKNKALIRKETSKVLRSNSSLTLFLVRIDRRDNAAVLPSFLGNFQLDVSAHFRDSDSIAGMSEEMFLFLCFGTDKAGASVVRTKIHGVLDKYLEGRADIHIGLSLFPEEARTTRDLLRLADPSRQLPDGKKHPDKGAPTGISPADDTTETLACGLSDPAPEVKAPDIDLSGNTPAPDVPLRNRIPDMSEYFDDIRGNIFFRLLQMEPGDLQDALMVLPVEQRQRFRDRLPWNSPLLEYLDPSGADGPAKPDQQVLNEASIRRLDAVVRRMSLEENLQIRQRRNREVMAVLKRSEDLPTLPAVAMRVFHLASKTDVDASQIAEVVTGDPALTAKLLKMVNSAFYGRQKKINNVQHALTILGTGELMDSAFGLAMAKVFDLKDAADTLKPEILWRHSVRTGIIAQALVTKLRLPDMDEVFTAGLLHDVGIIFGLEHFGDIYREIREHSNREHLPLFNLEEERFGMSHAAMGMCLVRSWNLPHVLVDAVAWHHEPQKAKTAPGLAAMIGLADFLDVTLANEEKQKKSALHEFIPWLSHGHWRILESMIPGLNESVIHELMNTARQALKDNASFIDSIGKL